MSIYCQEPTMIKFLRDCASEVRDSGKQTADAQLTQQQTQQLTQQLKINICQHFRVYLYWWMGRIHSDHCH